MKTSLLGLLGIVFVTLSSQRLFDRYSSGCQRMAQSGLRLRSLQANHGRRPERRCQRAA